MSAEGWTGDPALAQAASRALGRRSPVVAVAAVTPSGSATAHLGCEPQHDFEIGSISKPLTGMLYRRAVENDLVQPATTLGDLLPLDDHGPVRDVTLGALAVHRSGLPSLPPAMQPWRRTWRLWRDGTNPYGDTLAELLEQVRGVRVGAARPAYSNLGFQLLGHAVAAASGTTYRGLLHDGFGDGMMLADTERDLLPTSLLGTTAGGRPRAAWVGEALGPAGGVRATAATMAAFLSSTLAGQAPGMSALDPVMRFSGAVRIGAGWMTLANAGRDVTWHNGGTGGFRSWIGLDRAAGTGVAVLSATERAVDPQGFRLLGAVA